MQTTDCGSPIAGTRACGPSTRRFRVPRPATGAQTRRSAFTLLELLLAAMVSALVAVAGTTLVFAISNAAMQSRDIRAKKTSGHYALRRIANALLTARAVGVVAPTAIVLWTDDTNPDTLDELNLYEVALIRYDSSDREILYEYLASADPGDLAIPLDGADFSNLSFVTTTLANSSDLQSVVWAEDVDSCFFTGFPDNTDTRIIEVRFAIGTGNEAVDFHTAASIKAPADYLFNGQASDPDDESAHKRRTSIPGWDWSS